MLDIKPYHIQGIVKENKNKNKNKQ